MTQATNSLHISVKNSFQQVYFLTDIYEKMWISMLTSAHKGHIKSILLMR